MTLGPTARRVRVDAAITTDGQVHLGITAWTGSELDLCMTGIALRGCLSTALWHDLAKAVQAQLEPTLWPDDGHRRFALLLAQEG